MIHDELQHDLAESRVGVGEAVVEKLSLGSWGDDGQEDQMRRPNPAAQQRIVDAWNERVPVGAAVTVQMDSGEVRETTTRSKAELLGGHTAVVWLEGITGCYALSHVKGAAMSRLTDEEIGRRFRLYLAAAVISSGRDPRESDHLTGAFEEIRNFGHFVLLYEGRSEEMVREAFAQPEEAGALCIGTCTPDEAADLAARFLAEGFVDPSEDTRERTP